MESVKPSGSDPEYPQQLGHHPMQIEGDVVFVRFQGPYAPAEARQLLLLADEIYRRHGLMFLLADITSAVPPSAETRRIIAECKPVGRYQAALFGGSIALVAATRLMMTAQRLLGRGLTIEFHLLQTEAEARAWIAEQRRLRKES